MTVYVVSCVLSDVGDNASTQIDSVMGATFSTLDAAQDYLEELASKYEDDRCKRVDSAANKGLCQIDLIDDDSEAIFFHAVIIETELDEFAK